MLGRLLRFPYAAVKARAMVAGVLDGEALTELSRAPSLQAATALLRQRQRLDDSGPDRTAETLLRRAFLIFGERVARALPEREGRLVETYLRRADVENVKTACRTLTGSPGKTVRPLLVPTEGVGGLSVELLCRAQRIEDLPPLLGRHPYAAILRRSLGLPPDRRMHLLEIDLDRAFWEEVRSRMLSLHPFDRTAAEELLALRADVDRWRVVQRGHAARLAVDDIVAALPSVGDAFRGQEVRRALNSDRPDAGLKRLFPLKNVDPFSPAGELALFGRLRARLRRAVLAPPFDIAGPLAAVLLKELEARDLLAILGGLRLGRSIQPYLLSGGG